MAKVKRRTVKEFGAHPGDVYVGQRVSMRHVMCGLSQIALADKIGLTFQQLQKYESGVNRISASKLWLIAQKNWTLRCNGSSPMRLQVRAKPPNSVRNERPWNWSVTSWIFRPSRASISCRSRNLLLLPIRPLLRALPINMKSLWRIYWAPPIRIGASFVMGRIRVCRPSMWS